jgi:hypothetical protein
MNEIGPEKIRFTEARVTFVDGQPVQPDFAAPPGIGGTVPVPDDYGGFHR